MSEYLDEEEQIARLKSWWSENGTSIIVSVVIAVVAIVGWRWYGSYQENQAYSGAEAFAAYQSAGPDAKADAAATIAKDYNGSAYHVFVLFDEVKQAVAGSDLGKAEAVLNQVIDTANDPLLVDLAKVRLAKVQQGLGRSAQALATLETLSYEGFRAWGLEAKGDIHVERGELELAHSAYQAAKDSLQAGDDRPVLDMKLSNVAPFDGQYVEFGNTLEAALQDAQETLDSVVEEASQATAESVESVEDEAVESALETQPDDN